MKPLFIIGLPIFLLFSPLLLNNSKDMFSNDGPLGLQHSDWKQTETVDASWCDLNWLGFHEPSGIFNVSWNFFGVGNSPIFLLIFMMITRLLFFYLPFKDVFVLSLIAFIYKNIANALLLILIDRPEDINLVLAFFLLLFCLSVYLFVIAVQKNIRLCNK